MKKRSAIAFFLIALLLSITISAGAQTLKFASDPYPPYVMDTATGNGYVTDVTLAIMREAGYNAQYVNVPYARAIDGVAAGTYTGVLAVSPGREGFLYPQEDMGFSSNRFFVRKGSDWKWEGEESFEGIVFGAIEDYNLDEEFLNPYVAQYKNDKSRVDMAFGNNALETNIRKLAAGRVDVIMDDTFVIWYTAKQLGLADQIQLAEIAPSEQNRELFASERVTVGFSASNPNAAEYIRVMDSGLRKMKANGGYQAILEEYGLNN